MSYWSPELGTILNQDDGGSELDPTLFYGTALFPASDPVEIEDAITANAAACDYADVGKAVIGWIDGTTAKLRVRNNLLSKTGHGSGTTVTVGTVPAGAYWMQIVMRNATQGYVYYQASTILTAKSITIDPSDDSITLGSAETIATFSSGYNLTGLVARLRDANKIVLAFRDSNNSGARPIWRVCTHHTLSGTPAVSTILDSLTTSGSDEWHPSSMKVNGDRIVLASRHAGGTGEYTNISGIDSNTPALVDTESFSNSGRGGLVTGGAGSTTALGISISTSNNLAYIDELSNLDTATIAISSEDLGGIFGYNNHATSCEIGDDSAMAVVSDVGINVLGINNADGTPQIGGAGLVTASDPTIRPKSGASNGFIDCCKLSDSSGLVVWIDNTSNDLFMTRFR